jgi:Aconitase X
VHPDATVLVATSPEIKHAADRMGLTGRIEASGAVVAQGICFYQSYAREMAEANGWTRLMTNSAKLVNIIGGYARPWPASSAASTRPSPDGCCSADHVALPSGHWTGGDRNGARRRRQFQRPL